MALYASSRRTGLLLSAALLLTHCSDDGEAVEADGGFTELDVAAVDAGLDAGEPVVEADLGTADSGLPADGGEAPADGGGPIGPPVREGCGGVAAQGLDVGSVAPQDTDPALRSGDPDHRYVAAVGERTGRLFVFLPGATARPADYDDVLKNAAAGGDDAIGLAYVNDVRVFVVCGSDDNPDCHESLRIEVLRGEPLSPHVDVGPTDAILNRLVKLLLHLGWTDYLDGDEVRWSRIAVAGHSQGSGHAAMIGRFYETERVLLFAGTEPAPWTRQARLTPPERTWGFGHVDDPLFRAFPRSWDNLGILGPPETVDGVPPPFGGVRQLTTAEPPHPVDANPHNSPIGDTATPRDDEGRSLYAPVWCHMLGL